MSDYVLYKHRATGEWILRWRNNEPIPHYSFEDALETLRELMALGKHWQTTRNAHKPRTKRVDP